VPSTEAWVTMGIIIFGRNFTLRWWFANRWLLKVFFCGFVFDDEGKFVVVEFASCMLKLNVLSSRTEGKLMKRCWSLLRGCSWHEHLRWIDWDFYFITSHEMASAKRPNSTTFQALSTHRSKPHRRDEKSVTYLHLMHLICSRNISWCELNCLINNPSKLSLSSAHYNW
jgi:hypothetical protein